MPEKLRMRFSKTGRAIWLSHLDLMRTMQRAFLRAEYPLKYSEGFNPHARFPFYCRCRWASPASVSSWIFS